MPLQAAPLTNATQPNRAATGTASTVVADFQAFSSQTQPPSDRDAIEFDGQEEGNEAMDSEDERLSPRSALESYNERLNMARIRAEFESTLLTVLTLNVLYGYYVDHKLVVLFIRAIQVVRMIQFPYAADAAQWSTGLLVGFSNIIIVLIHIAVMLQHENAGRMLFLNFIGEEPKSALKTLSLDTLIFGLEVLMLRCRLVPEQIQLKPATPSTTSALEPVDTHGPDESNNET